MVRGIIGKKVGMTQVFDESGKAFPVTAIEAGPCPVVQIKTKDQDGYQAVQLGFGNRKDNKVNRPNADISTRRGLHLHEYCLSLPLMIPIS